MSTPLEVWGSGGLDLWWSGALLQCTSGGLFVYFRYFSLSLRVVLQNSSLFTSLSLSTCLSLCVSVSAKDKGEKKLFGFSFTPLMREDGTTLSDDSHELYVYKVRTVCRLVFLFSCLVKHEIINQSINQFII